MKNLRAELSISVSNLNLTEKNFQTRLGMSKTLKRNSVNEVFEKPEKSRENFKIFKTIFSEQEVLKFR